MKKTAFLVGFFVTSILVIKWHFIVVKGHDWLILGLDAIFLGGLTTYWLWRGFEKGYFLLPIYSVVTASVSTLSSWIFVPGIDALESEHFRFDAFAGAIAFSIIRGTWIIPILAISLRRILKSTSSVHS